MENLRKKNQTEILKIKSSLNQIKNAVEIHSSSPEQKDDRISGLEDKIDVKEKTEQLLYKRLKNWERNTQELSDSIKYQTYESWASKKEVQAEGTLI
jgi:chromosome segregation ATPase